MPPEEEGSRLLDLAPGDVHTPATVGVQGYSIPSAAPSQDGGSQVPREQSLVYDPVAAVRESGRPAALCLVADEEGRWLTVSRPEPPHEMSVPGGMVEDGETHFAAAARELLEECGVTVRDLSLVCSLRCPVSGRPVRVFKAGSYEGDASALEEGTTVAWMSPPDVLKQAVLFKSTVEKLLPLSGYSSDSIAVPMTISQDKRDSLAERDFAWPEKRKYPLDTAKRVRSAASYLVREHNRGNVPDDVFSSAKGRIRSAAKKFGVETELRDSDEQLANTRRPAQVHVRVDGLAHGGTIHVRHMRDAMDQTFTAPDGSWGVRALPSGEFLLRDFRRIESAEEVDPASVGVKLMSSKPAWPDGSPKKLVWVQLAETGAWKGHPAGEFTMTAATFAEIKANFEARGLPIQFDMEHYSELPAEQMDPRKGAPAHGWVHRMDVRQGPTGARLMGLTEWLEDARAGIQSGSYAFLSPAIRFGSVDTVSGRKIGARMTSVAITNQPFLTGLGQLRAARLFGVGDEPVLLKKQELSFEDVRNLVQEALCAKYPPGGNKSIWVSDLFDDSVIYQSDTTSWMRVGYEIDGDGKVSLKDEPEKVVRQYVPLTDGNRDPSRVAVDHRTPPASGVAADGRPVATSHVQNLFSLGLAHHPNEYMPKLRACLGLHSACTAAEMQDRLDTIRGHYDADQAGDKDGHNEGVRLSEHLLPLREFFGDQALGMTWEDLLDKVQSMIDASMQDHVDLYHSGGANMTDRPPTNTAPNTQENDEMDPKLLKDAQEAAKASDEKATKLETENGTLKTEVKTLSDKLAAGEKAVKAAESSNADFAEIITAVGVVALKDEAPKAVVLRLVEENKKLLADKVARDEADLERDVQLAFDTYKDDKKLDASCIQKADAAKGVEEGWLMSLARTNRPAFNKGFPYVPADQRHLLRNTTLPEKRPEMPKPAQSQSTVTALLMSEKGFNYADALCEAGEIVAGKKTYESVKSRK